MSGRGAPQCVGDGSGSTAPAASVHWALLVVSLSFGAAPVVGKVVLEELPVMSLVLIRVVLGAAALHLGRRGRLRIPEGMTTSRGRIVLHLILLSIFGVVINQSFFFLGLDRTTPVHAIMIVQTISPMTLILGIALGRERFVWMRAMGIALAFSGVAGLVLSDGQGSAGGGILGDLLIFLNAISYAIYLVVAQRTIQRLGAIEVVRWLFTIGAVILLPFALPSLLRTDLTQVSGQAWLGVAVIIAFPTVIAYGLNAWALARASATLVAVYIFLQPLVTSILDLILRGKTLTAHAALSGVVIMLGVALSTWRSRRGPTTDPDPR